MIFIVLKGITKALTELIPRNDGEFGIETRFSYRNNHQTQPNEKLDLYSYISLEKVSMATIDMCHSLVALVKDEKHAIACYSCSIVDCLLELLVHTTTVFSQASSLESTRPLSESILLGVMHVEILSSCLSFANTAQIRTQLFSSAAAKTIEDAAGLIITAGDLYLCKSIHSSPSPEDSTTIASREQQTQAIDTSSSNNRNGSKEERNRHEFGQWLHTKYYECDARIDSFLKVHLSVGNCLIS